MYMLRKDASEKPKTSHPCHICGLPVSLEECKIDERGYAVHECCYSARLTAEKRHMPRARA